MPFHLFAAKTRHAKRLKDEKAPCENRIRLKKCHAKRRNNAMRKDEKTKPATQKRRNFSTKRRKNAMRNDAIWSFNFVIFWRGVFSVFHMASFRLFTLRLFAWRYFVLSSFRMASFRSKRGHAKRRKDEITPCKKTKLRHADEITKRPNNENTTENVAGPDQTAICKEAV